MYFLKPRNSQDTTIRPQKTIATILKYNHNILFRPNCSEFMFNDIYINYSGICLIYTDMPLMEYETRRPAPENPQITLPSSSPEQDGARANPSNQQHDDLHDRHLHDCDLLGRGLQDHDLQLA